MCWETNNYSENGKMRIAERDIPVYKIVCETVIQDLISYYKGYPYKEHDKMPKVKMHGFDYRSLPVNLDCSGSESIDGIEQIDYGYHSYSCTHTLIELLRKYKGRRRKKYDLYMLPLLNYFKMRFKGRHGVGLRISGINSDPHTSNNFLETLDFYYFLNSSSKKLAVLFCVIPAGARYFLNEQGEYVSDTICTGKAYTIPSWFGAMAVNLRMLYYQLKCLVKKQK